MAGKEGILKMEGILLAAAEAAPFCQVGDLGEIVGSLPRELKGADVRVILPRYQSLTAESEVLGEVTVELGWRRQLARLERCEQDGVVFYFIANDYYFDRPDVYGYADDGERYAFFCRAVLEVLPLLEFSPKVIHCHDWHTGLIGMLLEAFYRQSEGYGDLRTVFTVHNARYQGAVESSFITDVLGIDEQSLSEYGLKPQDGFSFLQAGICLSDHLTTASASSAREIRSAMTEVSKSQAAAHGAKVSAIPYGINYKEYNPSSDPYIYAQYHNRALKKRLQNKLELQEALGLQVRGDIPLVGMVSRGEKDQGFELLLPILKEMMSLDIQLVIAGKGGIEQRLSLTEASLRYRGKLVFLEESEEEVVRRIYAGSDLFLIPSRTEPCGLSQLIAMRYGSLPVVRGCGGVTDAVAAYNAMTGEGCGFVYSRYDAGEMLAAVRQAVDLYGNRKVWEQVVRNAMKRDTSWQQPAKEYKNLYQQLTEG